MDECSESNAKIQIKPKPKTLNLDLDEKLNYATKLGRNKSADVHTDQHARWRKTQIYAFLEETPD